MIFDRFRVREIDYVVSAGGIHREIFVCRGVVSCVAPIVVRHLWELRVLHIWCVFLWQGQGHHPVRTHGVVGQESSGGIR